MLGVRRCHAATGRQVKKRKKCHFPYRLSNSSGENMRLVTAETVWTKAKKKATEINYLCANASETKIPSSNGHTASFLVSPTEKKGKKTLINCYCTNVGHAPSHLNNSVPQG
ncbi:hypothetical protein GOODEAATRI_019705 [Goodea atripinnis]|uniref:Uncharacterized protein n=1 Tax=Goodea atripinnis TaxID=208336 RepID=A0ABV0P696_9TELE